MKKNLVESASSDSVDAEAVMRHIEKDLQQENGITPEQEKWFEECFIPAPNSFVVLKPVIRNKTESGISVGKKVEEESQRLNSIVYSVLSISENVKDHIEVGDQVYLRQGDMITPCITEGVHVFFIDFHSYSGKATKPMPVPKSEKKKTGKLVN